MIKKLFLTSLFFLQIHAIPDLQKDCLDKKEEKSFFQRNKTRIIFGACAAAVIACGGRYGYKKFTNSIKPTTHNNRPDLPVSAANNQELIIPKPLCLESRITDIIKQQNPSLLSQKELYQKILTLLENLFPNNNPRQDRSIYNTDIPARKACRDEICAHITLLTNPAFLIELGNNNTLLLNNIQAQKIIDYRTRSPQYYARIVQDTPDMHITIVRSLMQTYDTDGTTKLIDSYYKKIVTILFKLNIRMQDASPIFLDVERQIPTLFYLLHDYKYEEQKKPQHEQFAEYLYEIFSKRADEKSHLKNIPFDIFKIIETFLPHAYSRPDITHENKTFRAPPRNGLWLNKHL